MRILVVEDELHLSEALSHILKKNNYTVDVANDGETGLDDALSGIYDVTQNGRYNHFKNLAFRGF